MGRELGKEGGREREKERVFFFFSWALNALSNTAVWSHQGVGVVKSAWRFFLFSSQTQWHFENSLNLTAAEKSVCICLRRIINKLLKPFVRESMLTWGLFLVYKIPEFWRRELELCSGASERFMNPGPWTAFILPDGFCSGGINKSTPFTIPLYQIHLLAHRASNSSSELRSLGFCCLETSPSKLKITTSLMVYTTVSMVSYRVDSCTSSISVCLWAVMFYALSSPCVIC